MSPSLLIVRPSLSGGGADRVTLTLLRHLPAAGFRVTLVLMRKQGELMSLVPPDIPIRSLESRSLWTAWLPLVAQLRKQAPDIVFSTSSGTNIVAALAHLLAGRPGRLVLSERSVLRTELSWKKKLQRWLKLVLYPRADLVTAVSRGVKEELVDRLRLEPKSVSVVYNPIVDSSLVSLAAEPLSHNWFQGASEDRPPVILTAGRLVAEKDHATLLRAFANLRTTHEARLVILGEGPLRTELESLAKALGISELVSLPGYDPNPLKYMSRCQMFVLSSRFEGLPGALIQAMACGAPVVSTDCPTGPSEIISDGNDGLLVPVGESEELASAMGRLLDDDDLSRRLGSNARESSRRFSIERSLPLYTRALLGQDRSEGT